MRFFSKLKADCAESWAAYTQHEFVRQIGRGILPEKCFRHYLMQDYIFLIEFARAYAIALYKTPDLAGMRLANASITTILEVEMDLHRRLCASWGIGPSDLENTPARPATLAYTSFVLETGLRGDLLDLHVVLSPCLLGYGEIGHALAKQQIGAEGQNPYQSWIDEYAGPTYQQAAQEAEQNLQKLADDRLTEARYALLARLFDQANGLEAEFWQAGLEAS